MADDWIERGLWYDWEPPTNHIVGEARRLANLRALAGPECEGGYCFPVIVFLVREADNPGDPNAIAAEVGGRSVGYLRRHIAALAAPPLDEVDGPGWMAPGLIRGGSYKAPNLGCHVWLERRLSLGPVLSTPPGEYEVAWPPREQEMRVREVGIRPTQPRRRRSWWARLLFGPE